MSNKNTFCILLFLFSQLCFSQRIEYETIDFELLKNPTHPTSLEKRNFTVIVNSPYNISKDDVIKEWQSNYQKSVNNYNQSIEDARIKHEERLKEYEDDVKKLKEKYKLESEQYSKLSAVEKIASTNTAPVLRIPSRPTLNIPSRPIYTEPDLKNALIIDNKIISSQIFIDGFTRGENIFEVIINLEKTNFQDNNGKTYANQPTKISIKENNKIVFEKTLFTEYELVASSPTNEINLIEQEKNYLDKVIAKTNAIINQNFGYSKIKSKINIGYVKNKGDYNDLEKAHVYVTTNLRKMQAKPDYNANNIALENLQKGIDIWVSTLKKVNYQDKKAILNDKIGTYIYFNLIQLYLEMENKTEAEKYLNQIQEHLVDIKLNYDQTNQLKKLEEKIYN